MKKKILAGIIVALLAGSAGYVAFCKLKQGSGVEIKTVEEVQEVQEEQAQEEKVEEVEQESENNIESDKEPETVSATPVSHKTVPAPEPVDSVTGYVMEKYTGYEMGSHKEYTAYRPKANLQNLQILIQKEKNLQEYLKKEPDVNKRDEAFKKFYVDDLYNGPYYETPWSADGTVVAEAHHNYISTYEDGVEFRYYYSNVREIANAPFYEEEYGHASSESRPFCPSEKYLYQTYNKYLSLMLADYLKLIALTKESFYVNPNQGLTNFVTLCEIPGRASLTDWLIETSNYLLKYPNSYRNKEISGALNLHAAVFLYASGGYDENGVVSCWGHKYGSKDELDYFINNANPRTQIYKDIKQCYEKYDNKYEYYTCVHDFVKKPMYLGLAYGSKRVIGFLNKDNIVLGGSEGNPSDFLRMPYVMEMQHKYDILKKNTMEKMKTNPSSSDEIFDEYVKEIKNELDKLKGYIDYYYDVNDSQQKIKDTEFTKNCKSFGFDFVCSKDQWSNDRCYAIVGYKYLQELFNPVLSHAYNEYLLIKAEEDSQPCTQYGKIVISSLEIVKQRIIRCEEFLKKYPEFIQNDDIKNYLNVLSYAYEYLLIKAEEDSQPYKKNDEIIVQFDTIRKRIIMCQEFLKKYPKPVCDIKPFYNDDIKNMLNRYLYAYQNGTWKTPVRCTKEEKKKNPEWIKDIRDSYAIYLKESEDKNSDYYKKIEKCYKLIK